MATGPEDSDGPSVLVVDDSDFFANMLARELADRTDAETEACTDPNAALGRLDGVDCVVSDYRMPELNGLELLDAVRADHDQLPFIILTGQGNEDVASEAIKRGATDYVTKQTIVEDGEFELLYNRIERGVYQHRARLQIERNRRQLRQQNEHLAVLNRMVSHDIRNDLQVVLGHLDLVAEHVATEGDEHVETIRESALHGVELTEAARELVDAAEDDSSHEPVDLAELIDEQLEELRPICPDTEFVVEGSLPETTVIADDMLEAVLRNLLTNAANHAGDAPTVTVSCVEQDDDVLVRVADDGPGVPDEEKDEIFAKHAVGDDSDGTGIGLYLVDTIVEQYGGEARVEDNEPSGAAFVVRLPAEQ